MKSIGIFVSAILVVAACAPHGWADSAALTADLTDPISPPITGQLKMGGKNPSGVEISANSQYLTLGGKPWFPVMGEIHYVRVPESQWEDEILKMKAGGITVVSMYCIWIYHEEQEGKFDWTGNRDLRRFVQLCAKHGMYVYARIGPWCHGEVRNGGFPDWLLKKTKALRKNDSVFLSYTRTWYEQVFQQLAGLLYKDGGPVIGIQLDNETGNAVPYLAALKQMAVNAGFDVPFYSYTGWNRSRGPENEMIPFYGGYPDGFWLTDPGVSRTGRRQYVFTHVLDDANITEHLTGRPGAMVLGPADHYPYVTCEIGGGMAISYARRVTMSTDDIAALPLVKIGSGANGLGYYMYHGGGDLIGNLSTLQESQATGYPNDLPVIDYDFQAPIGQFGQIRDSYRALRLLHMFLADFGSKLAPMRSVFPTTMPSSLADNQTLRWAVRSDGNSGFVFINNYERGTNMPDHSSVQFTLELANGNQVVPAAPANIASGSYMIWPFNLDMDGVTLRSSTAQLLCRLDGPVPCYVFFSIPGTDPQFDIAGATAEQIGALIHNGTGTFKSPSGNSVRVLLLTRDQAMHCCKAALWGQDRLLLSRADMIVDGSTLSLRSENPKDLSVGIFPPPPKAPVAEGQQLMQLNDGIMGIYSASVPAKTMAIDVHQLQSAGLPRTLGIGARHKPLPPDDADFDSAGVWEIKPSPDALDGVENTLLRIDYVGDAARAYVGDKLIDDDFYYGAPWEIELKRFAPDVFKTGITVKILPMPEKSPIFIQSDRRPDERADLVGVEPVFVYDLTLQCAQ